MGRRFLIAILAVGFLSACVTLATDYRKVGFREMQRGFLLLDQHPHLNETIELSRVRVHIVGNRRHFDWERAQSPQSRVLGYARRNNEIWVFGARVDGKIVLNQAVLGHEFNHLLNFADPRVADPDRLDDIGA